MLKILFRLYISSLLVFFVNCTISAQIISVQLYYVGKFFAANLIQPNDSNFPLSANYTSMLISRLNPFEILQMHTFLIDIFMRPLKDIIYKIELLILTLTCSSSNFHHFHNGTTTSPLCVRLNLSYTLILFLPASIQSNKKHYWLQLQHINRSNHFPFSPYNFYLGDYLLLHGLLWQLSYFHIIHLSHSKIYFKIINEIFSTSLLKTHLQFPIALKMKSQVFMP